MEMASALTSSGLATLAIGGETRVAELGVDAMALAGGTVSLTALEGGLVETGSAGGELEYEDLDDEELDAFLLNDAERDMKSKIWEAANKVQGAEVLLPAWMGAKPPCCLFWRDTVLVVLL